MATQEPSSLDPQIASATTDARITVALFEGLTALDEKTLQPLPGVAERWDVTSDGLTYTFYLRANAKWSNGERLIAQDFVTSFRRMLTPALGATYAFMLWPIKNARAFNQGKLTEFDAVGAQAVDEGTLRITLERPTPYLLSLVAHHTWFPVPHRTIEKFGRLDARGNTWTRPGNLVGNGAFSLTEWKRNARIVTKKNPHYWGADANRLEGVTFISIDQSDAGELSFRAGQLHVTDELPASKVPLYRRDSPELLRIQHLLGSEFLSFNVTKPPLDNPKVRRALALGLDRAAISARIYGSTSPPAHTLVPSLLVGYTPPPGPPDDFAAARELLAAAGFPGGRGFPVLTIQVPNTATKLAEIIQAMWQRELGVKITVRSLEAKSHWDSLESLAHEVALDGWSADYADPLTFLELFLSGNRMSTTGWGDKEYDALLDEASKTLDATRRVTLLQKAESILLREAPIAPIGNIATAYAIHPAVKNWHVSPLHINRYQIVELQNGTDGH